MVLQRIHNQQKLHGFDIVFRPKSFGGNRTAIYTELMECKQKSRKENEDRVAEEYLSSLTDLNCNSKPLINMLTMLAEENIEYAPVIVKVVEHHIAKVPPDFKLPILYLIDSIVKNVKGTYVQLFSQCIVNIFCGVFEKVNEKVRERMYALRQTWNEVFSPPKLYALDVKVKDLDNNWPITAKPSIHVNPNFFKAQVNVAQAIPSDVEEILHAKTRELLELKKRKLELELEATKKHLEAQEKQLSKTTETVMAPVDSLIAAAATLHSPNPQVAALAPGLMAPQHQIQLTTAADTRSGVFHHAFPNPKQAQQHASLMSSGIDIPVVQNYPAGHNIIGKQKVNPVNPAIINTVRHRDPRLARQQQMLQTNMTHDAENVTSKSYTSSGNKANRLVGARSSSDRDSKSHARSSSSTSGRASGGGNNSSSNRGKNKDRKRSESKTSTASYSSNGSISSSERRRQHSTASNRAKEAASKYDKDAFEIAPLSALKRKSSSPAGSPNHSKDSKRSAKSRSAHNKNRSHSRSPIRQDISNPDSIYRSLGQTSLPKETTTTPSDQHLNKEDHKPVQSSKDFDKSLDNFPSNSGSSNKQSTDSKAYNNDADDGDVGKKSSGSELHHFNANDDLRKRQTTEERDPLSNKSKVAKIDALFGTEDVDLRTLMPTQMLANNKKIGDGFPPPPPMISEESNKVNQNNENYDHLTVDNVQLSTSVLQPKTSPKKKSSSLDDVRAKLAKAAKYNNKFNKIDKMNKELSQRFKLAELNFNEDTQEANDEKIRQILTHAQELLETNSINQAQYKHLVQTMVSLSDDGKSKDGSRRRELALNFQREKHIDLEEENDIDSERIAARDAVLKKRIPKLNKIQQATSSDEMKIVESTGTVATSLPFYEDKSSETIDEAHGPGKVQKYNNTNLKEKRQKISKWAERGDKANVVATNANNNDGQTLQRAPWQGGAGGNRRPGGNFRSNMSHPSMPAASHSTMPPQMPWNINGPGSSAMHTAMPFNNQPLGLIRGNIPSSQVPSALSAGSILPKPCNSIDNPQADLVRTITIDGLAKEIRIYDQTSIVFMEQPREIGFQDGQRSIIIDNNEPIVLHFNDNYKSFIINGVSHSLRFGFPSRELYIDDNWYEIYFGGPPVQIPLHNKICLLKAEGPPPQVNIGPIRHDLVVGKLNMIIDAHTIVPVFLDAKLQKFRLGNEEHTIQFADNLLTLLLDGEARQVEYGGLPKSFAIGSKKYFVRFTALPSGIVAGKVKIKDMIFVKTDAPKTDIGMFNNNETPGASTVAHTANSITCGIQQHTADNLDKLSAPSTSETTLEKSVPSISPINALNAVSALGNLNIDELFKKLVSSGILSTPATSAVTASTNVETNKVKEKSSSVIAKTAVEQEVPKPAARRPIDLSKLDTIKTRQSSIVDLIFHGMQCSSCGVRFPPEQTIKYSQHLDWHFRQNRRERDLLRKANSRKWYYELNDWLQYEEIEDAEDRDKNFFETQPNDMDTNDESSNQRPMNSPVISCPACPEDVDRACDMCHEKFEQFYNEEMEEWHLRSALRVDEKIYHPLCFEDYKISLKVQKKKDEQIVNTEPLPTEENTTALDFKIKKEEDNENDNETREEVSYMDEDDDVIVLPNEDPSITEIVDDDDDEFTTPNAPTTTDVKEQDNPDEQINNSVTEAMESDVEIQEPHIPFTDLDTYEESQHSENVPSLDMLNIKIKEEPKDDYEKDEDDGFEEVGTILISPDEDISVHSEDTQNAKSAADATDEAPLLTSEKENDNGETVESMMPPEVNISMEGNLESEEEHNLSTAGPAPAVPLASLVNKIKINITKNTVNNNSSASTTTATIPTSKPITSSNTELNTCNVSQITVVSTIPVLCGGGTTTSSSVLIPVSAGSNKETYTSSVSSKVDTSVSNISVIGGSYGGASSTAKQPHLQSKPTLSLEDSITYEQKPLLKNAKLQKVKKIQAGVETSGLCSIM